MPQTDSLIIGAGPAGLAVAAQLSKKGLPYELLEQSDKVAFSWGQHYRRLHLHTAKEHSSLPFLPFPANYPRFVSRRQFMAYCEAYALKFRIQPHFGKSLLQVLPMGSNWQAQLKGGEKWITRNLILATGLNRRPHTPQWPGEENFAGRILHSRQYTEAKAFQNEKVLVVGMGNTGAEIALDLAENGIPTSISVRSPLNIVPREIFGRSTQATALKLQVLPPGWQNFIGKILRYFSIGNLESYGIKTSAMAPLEELRKTGKTPLIDLGTVAMIKKGIIEVKPDLIGFDKGKVVFSNGRQEQYTSIILATGYRSGVADLIPGIEGFLDPYGNPVRPVGIGKWSGLYFPGFSNYRPGGILGIINTDSKQIADHIQVYRTPLNQSL